MKKRILILKKLLTIILFSILSLSVYADPVDSLKALNYAKQFYGANNTAMKNGRMADFEFTIETKVPYNVSGAKNGRVATTNEFLYYVFNVGENNGFVIISGDDAALPVLGYSTTGHYDSKNLNPALRNWMKGYEEQLKYIKDNNLKTTAEIQQKWENMNIAKNARLAAVGPLIQTTWGQGIGYNDATPIDNNNTGQSVNSATGCVTTAMAQIMKYWEHPLSSNFEGYYRIRNGILRKEQINTIYSWAYMPNSVNSNSSTVERQAISTLMKSCGMSIKTNYSATSSGSSAFTKDVASALKDIFGYDKSIKYISRNSQSNWLIQSNWINILTNELVNNRPIIYHGEGNYIHPTENKEKRGSHAFIIDGINNNGLFHFNWGWGSSYQTEQNGFFILDDLTPVYFNFNNLQGAIIGIKPSTTSSNCLISFAKKEANISSNFWYKPYALFASRLGIIETINGQFNANEQISMGKAARSIVLTARALNLDGFELIDNEPCNNSNDVNKPFLNFLYRHGFVSLNEVNNSTNNITFGRLCKLANDVILGIDFPKVYRLTNYTKLSIDDAANYKESIRSVINIKGITENDNGRKIPEYTIAGFKNATITGNETVTNAILAKVVSNTFQFRFNQNKNTPETSILMNITNENIDNPDDFIEVGDKYENTSTPYGSQVPQYTLNPINMVSGQVRTFSFPDVTIGGLPVHVYWAVDGALGSQGSKLVPVSNTFQSVTFTAPTVTTPRTIQLYYYAATDGGYMAEFFQDIVVSPTVTPSGSITISPSSSSFNYGSITVGQTSSQTFTIQNTSSQNVTIDNYVLSGNGFVPLVGTTCCGVTLAPNQTTSIAVGFTPSQAGTAQGTLEINGGFTGSSTRIVLSGTGLANTAPTITTIPTLGSSVTFIDTKVGNYEDKIFTISNNSQSNFIGSFSVSGSAYSAFILNESGSTLNIPVGGTKYVYVRFFPTDNTTFTGSFTITGNASNTPSTFSLSGLGFGGPNYGCVTVNTRLITKAVNISQPGTEEFGRFTLTNTSSTKPASIINFKLVGWDKTRFTISPNYVNSTFSLYPSQSQEFIVYLTNISTQANYDGGISIQGDGCDYTDVTFRGVPSTSSVNAPELTAPTNNGVFSYPGGYTFTFYLQMKKKNTADLAKYLLYLYDETDGQVLYNFVDYGAFTSIPPEQFFTIRQTSMDNIYAKLGHRYSWKVRAVNTSNPDDYKDSPMWTFSVEQPPVCLPPSGVIVSDILSTTTQLGFVKYTYAQESHVQISYDNGATWGFIGNSSTGVFSISSLTAGTSYQVKVRSFCGQGLPPVNQYTYSGYSTPINFTTQALCQATISPSSSQNICFGQTLTLTASSGSNYQWYKDDILIQDATSQIYQVSVSGAYSVKVSQNDGCVSTSSKTTVNVIYTNAQVNVSGSTQICGSNTVTFSSPTTGLTYQWLKDNVNISGATNNSYTANQTVSYSLKITNQGCVVNSQSIEITPLVVLVPNIDPQTINSSQTATLTATGCAGTVTWYANATGGTGLTTGTSFTTPALTTTTTYYASCMVSSCESTTRGSGVVTVNSACTPPTVPNFPFQPTLGSAGTLTLNYSTMCSGGTLKWYDAQTAGNLLYTGGTYTTPILYSATNYFVSCTINDCESARGQLTVNYTPIPCVSNKNLTGNYGDASLQTNGTITSTSTILSGARTKFFAGQSITLNPGFNTSASSIFRAEIQNCVSNSGLIAYYPFNGNANDESGNLNHATNNGATLTTDRFGYFQKAYYFDGASNWIKTPLVQSNLTEYTISAWVEPSFNNNQEYVILQNRGASPGSGKGFTLHYQYSSSRWGFALDGDATYIGKQAPYPNNTNWVHVVATWSAGSATSFSPSQFNIYINGVLQSSAVSQNIGTATVPSTPTGTAAIGRSEAWNNYFKGKIDDLRVYNRALNATEVKSIYNFER